MTENVNERVKSTVLEGIGQRKTMFVPMVCISSFMLVGYAALDREAPEVITTSLTMELGQAQKLLEQGESGIDYSKIAVVDNRDDRDLIKVYANTDMVDFTKPGEYTIPVTATDSFNNQSSVQEVSLTLVDTQAPEFIAKEDASDKSFYTNGNVYHILYNSSTDIRDYVSAIDDDKSSGLDGNLTDFIVQHDSMDTSKVGSQLINISVSDNSDNPTRKSIPIVIIDTIRPELDLIQTSQAFINYGSEFNIADYVNAYDELDGDLNEYVVVGGDEVDTSVYGAVYNITVKVSDFSNNEYDQTFQLTVSDTEKPEINFSKNNFLVKLNDTINIKDYVTVTDNYDTNIADKVTYSATSIDTSTTGTKSITITAVDEAGNDNFATFTVEVIDPSLYSGTQIVSIAKTKVGSAYIYGASGPNAFDCSGFTQWVYANAGISIPRTASTQFSAGKSVSRSDLQPGDIVFFNTYGGVSHCGIYIGDNMMIHAGTTNTGVAYANITSSYWTSRYLGARRYS